MTHFLGEASESHECTAVDKELQRDIACKKEENW